jgi:hypothetical protein
MSDKYRDALPLIIGALVGLLIYLSRKKAFGAQELNVTVNESVSVKTNASLSVVSPIDVVVNDGLNISTSANLSVTAPAPAPPPVSETNVIVNDGASISTDASLSVA